MGVENGKKIYYVAVANGEISQNSTSSSWDYKIEATDEEVTKLREYFDQIYSSDWKGFYRAHTPYLEYHYDRENDAIDQTNIQVYKMIYELGDEEAKAHIKEQGIISNIEDQA
ncbi:hydrolase [Metabacillus arenae]|uniref:Hydrolase n=1 Tax=Metabacillus arenae TaxID=2771434 RepID=A0A926NLI2_9BACI|nr:hydrolase [Metabacillus arenae]MBD1380232.1 hydrolase [Metabacillus arenae]